MLPLVVTALCMSAVAAVSQEDPRMRDPRYQEMVRQREYEQRMREYRHQQHLRQLRERQQPQPGHQMRNHRQRSNHPTHTRRHSIRSLPTMQELRNKEFELSVGTLIGKVYRVGHTQAVVLRGVPYAEPPTYEFRFKKPLPKENLRLPLEAFEFGAACIQFLKVSAHETSTESMKETSEDCLYMNIYAPERAPSHTGAPVLVWVHGGSYQTGSGNSLVDEAAVIHNFVSKGIAVVTINYRLGGHGFIVGPTDQDSNYGMWDMVEALHFISDHGEMIGLDPDRVTLMGESAGASATSILALSETTRGKLHSAIILSGSAGAWWAGGSSDSTGWKFENVLDYLTCKEKIEDHEHLYEDGCPFIKNYEQGDEGSTVEEQWEYFQKEADFGAIEARMALIQGQFGHSYPIIDREIIPYNLTEMVDRLPRMPVMLGVADLEWQLRQWDFQSHESYKPNMTVAEQKKMLEYVVRRHYNSQYDNATLNMIVNATHYHYFGQASNPRATQWSTGKAALVGQTLDSDLDFVLPAHKEASSYALHGQPVYLYIFEHTPAKADEVRFASETFFGQPAPDMMKGMTDFKAFHGLDHAYIFSRGIAPMVKFAYTHDDEQMSTKLTSMIANFVKNKNPTPDGTTPQWPQYEFDDPHYMRLRNPPEVVDNDLKWPTVSFWRNRVPQLAKDFQNGHSGGGYPASASDAAYARLWWALWVLVALLLLLLLIGLCCLLVRRWMGNTDRVGQTKKAKAPETLMISRASQTAKVF